MLHRLKQRLRPDRDRPFAPTRASLEEFSLDEAEGELLDITRGVLRRAGVDAGCVALSIERMAAGPERHPTLRTMVSLVRWDPTSALHLLLGLAHIERAMRRSIAASWLAESCHFAGVWVHPSEAILESGNLRQLAAMLGSRSKGFPSSSDSAWAASSGPQPDYEVTVPSEKAR